VKGVPPLETVLNRAVALKTSNRFRSELESAVCLEDLFVLQVLVKRLDPAVVPGAPARLSEDLASSRLYAALLRCLQLVLVHERTSLEPQVSLRITSHRLVMRMVKTTLVTPCFVYLSVELSWHASVGSYKLLVSTTFMVYVESCFWQSELSFDPVISMLQTVGICCSMSIDPVSTFRFCRSPL
jgi:hypothetical protein